MSAPGRSRCLEQRIKRCSPLPARSGLRPVNRSADTPSADGSRPHAAPSGTKYNSLMRCARLPGSCIAETARVSQLLLLLYNRDLYSSRLDSASVLRPQTLHTSAERYNNLLRKAAFRTAHTSRRPLRFPWYSGAPASENDDSSELYRSDRY